MKLNTRTKYAEAGRYVEEREMLHRDIVLSHLAGISSSESPSSILLGGGSASGKSTIGRLLVAGYHSEKRDIVIIDSDKIKAMLPEYAELIRTDPDHMAEVLHDESSDIADRLLRVCISERRNFLYDGTMKNYLKYRDIIQSLHEHCFSVTLVVVDVSVEEAIRRAEERFMVEQRRVPSEIIVESHRKVASTFYQIRDMVQNYTIFDTTGQNPVVFAQKISNIEIILNQERLLEFYRKGDIQM